MHFPALSCCTTRRVLLDPWPLLEGQEAVMVRGTFAQIHLLHPFLDQETLVTVTHALVSSHLGYCNVFYRDMVAQWLSR